MLLSDGVGGVGPARQSYVERPPVAALAGHVSSMWIQQVAPETGPYTQRNIPNGGVELLCPVGAMPRVIGPVTRALVEVLAPGTTVVGVRLHPGAARSVLGLPASELVDLTLETDELWGSAAVVLGERVDAAASPDEALAGLQRHIVGRVADASAPDPLVAEAVRQLRAARDRAGQGADGRWAGPARRRGGLRRPAAPEPRVPAADRRLTAGVPRGGRAHVRLRARPRGLVRAAAARAPVAPRRLGAPLSPGQA